MRHTRTSPRCWYRLSVRGVEYQAELVVLIRHREGVDNIRWLIDFHNGARDEQLVNSCPYKFGFVTARRLTD